MKRRPKEHLKHLGGDMEKIYPFREERRLYTRITKSTGYRPGHLYTNSTGGIEMLSYLSDALELSIF